MTTHELKLQQSTCQSGETASVSCAASNHERFNTHIYKTRFQNVSGHEKLHPEESAQHIHNKRDSETAATFSQPPHLTGQQKSCRYVQIRQLILLRSKKDSNSTSTDQRESARFTTVISISLPTKRNKKDTVEDNEETLPVEIDFNEAIKKTANQQHTELKDLISPTCNKSDGELLKDGPKVPFDDDSISTLQIQHGLNIPNQIQDTGIQDNIGLHKHMQTVHSDSQKPSSQRAFEIHTKVSKCSVANKESRASDIHREHTPTTLLYHNNQTSLGEDSGLKVVNQVLSFHAPHSGSTPEPELSLINPASDMLSSALVSVLAPPWSGRLRRPKLGSSELEHEPQNCGQSVNPSTLFRQDRLQQPLIATHRLPAEHMSNDGDMQFTAGTSYSTLDWQKENNSPNVTTAVQSKRPMVKSSSVNSYRGTLYHNAKLHRVPTSLDTGQILNLPPSEERRGYTMSNTEDQNEPFKSLSSKPTTSSLLLSLRRTNLRRSNAEPTQMDSQITRSLTLPRRSILKNAQYNPSVTPDDQTRNTLVSYPFPDTPSKMGIVDTSHFPSSPRVKQIVALEKPMLINKTGTDILKKPGGSVLRAEEEPFKLSPTNSSQPGIVEAQQHCHLVNLRKYSNTENSDQVEQSTANNTKLHNLNTISSKEKRNVNLDYPQTVRNVESQSTQNIPDSNSSMRTFTDRLNFSPRKENSSVDGNNTTNWGHIYLDSKKHSLSSQSSMDLSSPLSPSRPIRGIQIQSIYSYLRESSPNVSSPNSPSTPFSHLKRAVTSSSPKQDGCVILHGDREPLVSRFSFDLSPVEPQVKASKRDSNGASALITPAQSLPPDFGRRSAPCLSTSPYSILISSRPALNSTIQGLSSPPAPKQHDRSTLDTATIRADPIKGDPTSSHSIYTSFTRRPKDQLASPERDKRTENAYTCALDNHRPAQPCLSQTVPDASFVMESPSTNITTHPRQHCTGPNNIPLQENDGSMVLQLDKGNANPKHRRQLETYLHSKKLTAESETPLIAEKEINALHMDKRLQEIQSPNSKKAIFALGVKKDNVTLDPMPDKEVVPPQYLKTKRNSPVFKTSSRIDQMLNRLKMTFSVKRLESTLDTVTKKSRTSIQQPSDTENLEKNMTVEKKSSRIQWEPPQTSLDTDKAYFPSSESMSPVKLKKSWNTLNVNQQNRCMDEKKGSGIQWKPPVSDLTTDKVSFPSSESLSPVKLKKSDNTLNVDQQNRCRDDKSISWSQWEHPNSSLTVDKASFPCLESASPLTLRKSKNTLIVDQHNRFKDEYKCSWRQWEHPKSSLSTDEASLPSLEYLSPSKLPHQWSSDENGNRSSGSSFSPRTLKPHGMNRSATLPHYKKSSVGPPSPFYLFDFDSEDIRNDNVFYSPLSKKSNSLCESDNGPQLCISKSTVQQNLMRTQLSYSCADLKYGLDNGRSFSVSSVFTSRPSGPKRISTSSISDLSSLEDFSSKGSFTKFDSPINNSNSPSYGAKYVTSNQTQPGCTLPDDHLWTTDKQENSSDFLGDADPTPPPSPPFSPSFRRMSQAPAISSPIRTTPENLSPRGILPSRSYTASLTVFEESSSDTTTDDEYYLDDGDEVETEL